MYMFSVKTALQTWMPVGIAGLNGHHQPGYKTDERIESGTGTCSLISVVVRIQEGGGGA